jgi:hypothetical protein
VVGLSMSRYKILSLLAIALFSLPGRAETTIAVTVIDVNMLVAITVGCVASGQGKNAQSGKKNVFHYFSFQD